MAMMNAAVVTSFAEPPHYQRFEVLRPRSAEEVLVDVLAVGLHPRVRSGAAGAHYTSTGTLPMIPGIDAVGQRPDGRRVYFVAADDVIGTMADRALADPRRSIVLPGNADVAKVAAAMNPAMSSWVALRRRVQLERGNSVLILGATGNAGAMAVQVAKLLGAGRVVGAGRDLGRLQALTSVGAEGSGQGAVGPADYLAEMPSLIDAISNGAIAVKANTMPLADVEEAWTREEAPGERTVLVP